MEVATARSMSLAAAKLGMTQSAVSQAMRKLEADLGVTLVVRGRRPVTLTAAGVTLEQRAEPLLREAAGLPRDAPDRNYRDANHKPELICALTPFAALVGFRAPADSVDLLRALDVPAIAAST